MSGYIAALREPDSSDRDIVLDFLEQKFPHTNGDLKSAWQIASDASPDFTEGSKEWKRLVACWKLFERIKGTSELEIAIQIAYSAQAGGSPLGIPVWRPHRRDDPELASDMGLST
jgi:hypothetical protein